MSTPAVISDPPRGWSVASCRPAERWWRSFFESSEDAQLVCNLDGVAVEINPRAARLLKLDRAVMEGSFCVGSILQPPADQRLSDALRRTCAHPDALHSVALFADGRQRALVDLELAPLDDQHTLVTFKDVARRMRLESHVNRLVTAIDATPEVFFLTDAECRITFVNPAFHTLTGYDIESVLDRTDEFLRAPSEAEKISAYLAQVRQGRDWMGELVNIRSDGTPYQVEATISPISDMMGCFIGYVACERDITARNKLEEDHRLLQDQLFQSQKMEIIGTLAAGVAHDFNNLLQAIRGNTSLVIMESPPGSNVRHWGGQINLAATRAAEITQQLLSFSRRSGEKSVVLDLNQIIHEAGQLARRTLRANVNLEIVLAPEPVPVKMELSRATQTLLNLCVNAQDAMPDGGTLTISNAVVLVPAEVAARHDAAGGEFARCSVADTGCGIPANLLPRIFEAFFSTKEKGHGTGLGLSIVRRIMQEAGGFVDVESVVGHGATFRLYFPIARENLTAVARPAEVTLARGQGRVLVVDDLELLRDFAKTFLEAAGLTAFVAASGREALQVLEKENGAVDVLFTDYAMGGMNGADLIEQVAVRWPQIRPMLASGYLDDPIMERLKSLNAKVLAKPYEMQEAADAVIALLPKLQPA